MDKFVKNLMPRIIKVKPSHSKRRDLINRTDSLNEIWQPKIINTNI